MSEWYVGIDLGTTNSALSTCRINDSGDIIATSVDLKRKARSGGPNREIEEKTLPSCVKYNKNDDGNYDIIVGDYAKEQYSTRPDTVAKSIKTQMGNPFIDYPEWDSGIPDKTPEEVSSRILKHMMEALKRKKRGIDDDVDVVITIPASFGPDQRMATLKAAEMAGINVKKADGSYNGRLLLSEPEAVMYHLINSINEKKIDIGIDFDVPKNILIFDIGGGTLDVTIHQVEKVPDSKIIKMKQLSINKYTAIAGDVFDKKIAEFLIDKYVPDTEKNKNNSILLSRAMIIAEGLKKYISQEYEDLDGNIDLDEEFEANEDLRVGSFELSSYDCTLTKGEFESCLSDLIANDFVYDDYKRIDDITDTHNIIYPILYALSEAEKKAEKEHIQFNGIDAVVLNGGMSKLYLIEERIENFFGQPPITEVNPDLSVAQGASIYNYYLHHEDNVENIVDEFDLGTNSQNTDVPVNNTIKTVDAVVEPIILMTSLLPKGLFIGYKNGTFEQIAEDNANLPLTNNISGKVLEGQRLIYVPIYVEEPYKIENNNQNGKTYKKQIASGIIPIKTNLKKDCYVSLNCTISKDQILSISATITSDYLGMNELETTRNIEIAFDEIEGNGKDSKLTAPKGKDLDVNNEISSLITACNNLHKAKEPKSKTAKQKQRYETELKIRVKSIKDAGNKEEFADAILKALSSPSCDEVTYNLLPLAHFMCTNWSESKKSSLLKVACDILNRGKQKIEFAGLGNDIQFSKIINFAIQIIGKIGDEKAADILSAFLPFFEYKSYVLVAFSTLGINYDIVYEEFLEYNYTDKFAIGIIWAIGNCFRKSHAKIYKISEDKIVDKIVDLIKTGQLKLNELRCAETSMALICDKRAGITNPVFDRTTQKALHILDNIGTYYPELVKEQEQTNIIARKMINGEMLNILEEEILDNTTNRLFDKSVGNENDE